MFRAVSGILPDEAQFKQAEQSKPSETVDFRLEQNRIKPQPVFHSTAQ